MTEAEKMANDINTSIEAIKTDLGNAVKSEDFVALQNQVKELPNTEAVAAIKQSVDDALEAVLEIKERNTETQVKGLTSQIKEFVSGNVDKLKSIMSQGHGVVELTTKAVGDITTGNAVNVGTVPTIYGETAPINLKDTFIEGVVSTSNTNSPNYAYTEVRPKDGDYAFLNEGDTKPQIDFNLKTEFAKPKKIAAWEKLTMEAVQDVPRMESLAREILLKKHNLFKQRGILSGDGVDENVKGLTTYGRVFSAGEMALKVENPTFIDVVNACITDIRTTHNYQDETPYQANVVLVNDVDYFLEVQSAKEDATTRKHLYSDAMLIGGVRVIPTPEVATGKILVCDASKYNLVNYMPYTVKIGWVNDDFIKNQFVILAESRFYGFVKKLDEQAFIYDDIATVKAAITKA